MDSSGTANEVNVPSVSSDAETTAVRIVSNLPRGQHGTPNGVQAEPSGAVDDEVGDSSDDDEDLDMDQLEEDWAEWEEELDQGAWDDVHGAALIYSKLHVHIY